MGQKVNPHGLRVGVIADWDSRWYAEADFADYLVEDNKLRKYLKETLKTAGISSINIERKGTEVKVDNIIVEPDEKHEFVLEWRWLFDGGNDTIDTYYGTKGGIYSIYLNLSAEQYMEE